VEEVLTYARTIVIGNNDPEFRTVPDLLRDDQSLVDFVRMTQPRSLHAANQLTYA